ncbi:MAG: hypothetical protein IT285_15235 [Bdellovibrionales bacterium]|nr:hypothetical protein [Bdellovibrionales bacterium]
MISRSRPTLWTDRLRAAALALLASSASCTRSADPLAPARFADDASDATCAEPACLAEAEEDEDLIWTVTTASSEKHL